MLIWWRYTGTEKMFRKLKRSAGLRRIGEQDERREPVMKILITTDWYTPAVNGVVTSVKNLQRELERRGHEVRILTLSQSLHSWSRDGVTAIGSVNAGRIYPGARLRTAMAGRWVRELMDWRPDVIHSQCEFSTFFLARRIAEELDVESINSWHFYLCN